MKERDYFWTNYTNDIAKLNELCNQMIECESVCAISEESTTKTNVFKYFRNLINCPIERDKIYKEIFEKMVNIFLISSQTIIFTFLFVHLKLF